MLTKEVKGTGVEWLGKVPRAWDVIKLRRVVEFINGYAFKSSKFTSPEKGEIVITIRSFNDKGLVDSNFSYSNESFNKEKYLVKANDILLAMSGGTVGKNLYLEDILNDCYINQRVGIIRSNNNKLIYYWLNSFPFEQYVNLLANGSAQPNISSQDILNFKIVKPTLQQIDRITNFLDEKIDLINRIVLNTQKSIVELKNYKQSLIIEAVTKGLINDVEMRKSQIEWIDECPAHWHVIKGKYLFKKMERKIQTNEVITAFRDGQVIQRKRRRDEGFTNSAKEVGYQGIKKGDLVIHSMDAFAGAIGVSEDDGKGTPAYIVLEKRSEKLNSFYYAYLLRSYSICGYIDSMAKGIRVRSTDFKYNSFSSTLFLVPPKNEQDMIVKYLDREETKIKNLILKKQSLISELKKYKKTLIYEYITGKKEV